MVVGTDHISVASIDKEGDFHNTQFVISSETLRRKRYGWFMHAKDEVEDL